jgi:catechol 2,3-dioxygenase-like lactoylglutathione lyase family enzyme
VGPLEHCLTDASAYAAGMSDNSQVPRWRGVNHLALVTTDMDATTRFYHGVLGARLVATIGTPAFRHYFFEIGAGNTVAFFEYHGADIDRFAKPAGIPDRRAMQFDHLSLNLADEHALESLRRRLKSYGCEVTDVVDHGVMRSIYFTDPNGIALEASWWVTDATGRDADYGDRDLFADLDPVPAVRELVAAGDVQTTPFTNLTHDPTDIADPA